MIKNIILGFVGVMVNAGHVNHSMVGLAEELRAKGIKVWVVTSVRGERQYYLSKYPFLKDMDAFHQADKMGLSKKEPATYLKLLSKKGLLSVETIFFDDSEQTVYAAQQAGIEAYFFHDAEGVHKVLRRKKVIT